MPSDLHCHPDILFYNNVNQGNPVSKTQLEGNWCDDQAPGMYLSIFY